MCVYVHLEKKGGGEDEPRIILMSRIERLLKLSTSNWFYEKKLQNIFEEERYVPGNTCYLLVILRIGLFS